MMERFRTLVSTGEPTRRLEPAPTRPVEAELLGFIVYKKYKSLDWEPVTEPGSYAKKPLIFKKQEEAEIRAISEANGDGQKSMVVECRIVAKWEGYGGAERTR